jgi:hypothetical protein
MRIALQDDGSGGIEAECCMSWTGTKGLGETVWVDDWLFI